MPYSNSFPENNPNWRYTKPGEPGLIHYNGPGEHVVSRHNGMVQHSTGRTVIVRSAGEINAWRSRRQSRETNKAHQSAAAAQVMGAAAGSPIRIIYGTQRVGADLIWWGTYNGNLVLQVGWCLGEVEAVNKIFIGGEALPDEVTTTHYLGTPTQGVDPTLSAAITGFNNPMVFAVAGQTVGLCYSVLIIPPQVINGFPRLVGEVKGRKIYDPRDGVQLENDPSTWKYSENPSLVLADFETSALYGRGKSIDWDSVKVCANANDDNTIGEKRNTLNLALEKRQSVNLYTETLARYANVFINNRNGKTTLVPDRPTASSGSISVSDVKNLKLSEPKLSQRPTVVTIRYTDTSGDKWTDATAVAKLAGVDEGNVEWREQALDMQGIITHSEAYRYAVEQLNALTIVNLEGSFETKDTGITYEVGDVRDLSHPRGVSNELIQLTSVSQTEVGRWVVQFIEYDAGRFSDEVVTGPNYDDTFLPSPLDVPQVLNLSLTEEVYQLREGNYASRIRATWDPIDYLYGHQFKYQVFDPPNLIWQGFVDGNEFVTGALKTLVEYTVKVSAVSTQFDAEGLVSSDTIQSLGKRLKPGDVPQITATQIAADALQLQWIAAVDLDIWRYEVRQGGSWDIAETVDVVDGRRLVVSGLALGAHTFLIKPIDSVGQYSANATTVVATIVAPGAPSSLSGFEAGGTVRLSWPPGTGFISTYEVRHGPVGFDWDNGTRIDKILALRVSTTDIAPGTREFAVKSVGAVDNYSINDARVQLTVTLDAGAFLADEIALTNPTLTNMASWSPRDGEPVTYVTDMGDSVASLWPNAMSTYTNTLATYHSNGTSEWLSESANFGSAISGTWLVDETASALSGTITKTLELSTDNVTWTQFSSLTTKATARYARLRLQATGASTLKVTTPGVAVQVSVVPREETHNISYDADLWAVKFDGGLNDYMEITNATGWPSGNADFTYEIWAYKNAVNPSYSYSIILSTGELRLAWFPNRIGVWSRNPPEFSATPTLTSLQEWVHLAFSYDASTQKLVMYANGKILDEYIFADPLSCVDKAYVFSGVGGNYRSLNGKFHQLRYWNTVRTQHQIQDNLWKELTGTEPGLVGLWPGNDGSGTTVADLTSNNNDGLLQNGAGFTPRGKTVALDNDYAATQSIIVSPLGSTARTYAVDNIRMGDPSFFEVFLFDPATGNRVDGDALVTFKGV